MIWLQLIKAAVFAGVGVLFINRVLLMRAGRAPVHHVWVALLLLMACVAAINYKALAGLLL